MRSLVVTALLLLLVVAVMGMDQWRKNRRRIKRLEREFDAFKKRFSNDYIEVKDGYFMAFRLEAHNGRPSVARYFEQYRNDDDSPEVFSRVPCECLTTDGRQYCGRHIRSRILDQWNDLKIERIRLGIYKDGVEQQYIEFYPNTNYYDWFDRNRIVETSFGDLQALAQQANIFGLEGDAQFGRYFYINNNYGTCDTDRGWVVVNEPLSPNWPCTWDSRGDASPIIKYANGNLGNWNNDETFLADLLIISVKLAEPNHCPNRFY